MIAGIHILQEIFAIDVLMALKPSLKHDRKHVLRLLRLYGDQALQLVFWLVIVIIRVQCIIGFISFPVCVPQVALGDIDKVTGLCKKLAVFKLRS